MLVDYLPFNVINVLINLRKITHCCEKNNCKFFKKNLKYLEKCFFANIFKYYELLIIII